MGDRRRRGRARKGTGTIVERGDRFLATSRHEGAASIQGRRVLFAFDPRRHAILLLGGDKSGLWEDWYRRAIPEADRLYDIHLEELRSEGLLDGDQ